VLYRVADIAGHSFGRAAESSFKHSVLGVGGDARGYGDIDRVDRSQNVDFADKDLPGCKDSRSHFIYPGNRVMNEKISSEAELTAYCGLYCGDCIRFRSKTTQLAKNLMTELQAVQFDKYAEVKSTAVKKLEHYDECIQVLDAIVKLGCDTPCKAGGEGCVQPCEVKSCVESKHLGGCWECDGLETCDKFEFLKPVHGDTTKANLRKIKEYGLDGWAKHRNKFYSWL
jgi:hypothetical protein